jgi:hypothetical protein
MPEKQPISGEQLVRKVSFFLVAFQRGWAFHAGMNNIQIVSEQTEEKPVYYDFTKYEFMAPCPGMADLKYDPFPGATLEEVVRKEIVARKWDWRATRKGDVLHIQPGVCVERNGHKFGIIEADIDFMEGTSNVLGDEYLSPPDVPGKLAQLRKMFAEQNPK